MMGARIWCRSLAICAFVLGLAAIAVPSYAQTGQVKGKVVDANGKPIEGAVVTIEGSDSGGRKFTVKTNKNGDYIQIGLQPGQYKITAVKDQLTQSSDKRIGLDMVEVNFALKPGGDAGDMSDEDRKKAAAKTAAIKTAFDEGVTLSNAGKNDEAIAKFNEVLAHGAEVRRVLLQHRRQLRAEEGLGAGGGVVQEGDRTGPELSRGVQRARQRLQRTEEVRSGGGGQRAGDEAGVGSRRGRRRGGRRGERVCDVQPGRHPVERGQDS